MFHCRVKKKKQEPKGRKGFGKKINLKGRLKGNKKFKLKIRLRKRSKNRKGERDFKKTST
jgi:hypothetical protein